MHDQQHIKSIKPCWVVMPTCLSCWEQQSLGSPLHKGNVGVNTTIRWTPTSSWNVLPDYQLFFAGAVMDISFHPLMERTCPRISTGGKTIHWAVGSRCVHVSCSILVLLERLFSACTLQLSVTNSILLFPLDAPLCRIMPSHNNQTWPDWVW